MLSRSPLRRKEAKKPGVDEDDEAQIDDDRRQLHVGAERAEGQPDEQHRGHAQADALDLDMTEHIAQAGDDEQQENRLFHQEFDE